MNKTQFLLIMYGTLIDLLRELMFVHCEDYCNGYCGQIPHKVKFLKRASDLPAGRQHYGLPLGKVSGSCSVNLHDFLGYFSFTL